MSYRRNPGTYYMRGLGRGHTGHTYSLSRDEVENLIGARTDGPWEVGNVVTRKKVRVSDKRPLTAQDVARISNEPAGNPRHYADTLKGNPHRRGGRSRFRHRRVRAPGRFVKRSLRTVKSGKARVVVGHLRGERKRTRRGRRRLTVQAVLTPKRARRNPPLMAVRRLQGLITVGHGDVITFHDNDGLTLASYVVGSGALTYVDRTSLANRVIRPTNRQRQIIEGALRPQTTRESVADVLTMMASGTGPGHMRTNPMLAVVGANPPMGRVVEIRYHRDRGAHPGYYKHSFRHRPVMVALNDGSLKIGPH